MKRTINVVCWTLAVLFFAAAIAVATHTYNMRLAPKTKIIVPCNPCVVAGEGQWKTELKAAIKEAMPMASPADTKRQLPIPLPPKALIVNEHKEVGPIPGLPPKVAAQRKECAWCPFINGRAADGHRIASFSFHMNAE